VGIVVLLLVSLLSSLLLGLLSAIAAMGAVFVLTGVVVLWPMTPDSTRHSARREDYRPHIEELLVVAAALGSLVGIVVLLILGNSSTRNSAAAIGSHRRLFDLGDAAPDVHHPICAALLPRARGRNRLQQP
jgi:uncharacterized membrane protein